MGVLREFRTLWTFFFAFTLICSFATSISTLFPECLLLLSSSSSSPWGIVTGIFVHASFTHLLNNVLLIALYLAVFMALSEPFSFEPRGEKSAALVVDALLAAIVADFVSVILVPGVRSVGASGVGFAILGAALAEASKNSILTPLLPPNVRKGALLRFIGLNLFFSLFTSFYLLFAPGVFFVVVPGVNFLVHACAFYFGFLCYLAYLAFSWVNRPGKGSADLVER